jgi:hypothetical protein
MDARRLSASIRRLSDGCHVVILSNNLKSKVGGILAMDMLSLLLI